MNHCQVTTDIANHVNQPEIPSYVARNAANKIPELVVRLREGETFTWSGDAPTDTLTWSMVRAEVTQKDEFEEVLELLENGEDNKASLLHYRLCKASATEFFAERIADWERLPDEDIYDDVA